MDLKVDDQYWTVKTVELVRPKNPSESMTLPLPEVELTLEPSQTGSIGWGVWIGGTPKPKPIKVRGRNFNEALGNASVAIRQRIKRDNARKEL